MLPLRCVLGAVVCCLFLAGIYLAGIYIPYIFDAQPAIPAKTLIIQVQMSDPGALPFRCGNSVRQELDFWIRKTKKTNSSDAFKQTGELIFLDCFNGELLRIPLFRTETHGEDDMYIRLHGRTRKGSYTELMKIVSEPATVRLGAGQLARYEDRNNDGQIDTKVQLLDSHSDVIWKDTDFDSVFDQEYLWNNASERGSFHSRIRIPVPSIEAEETSADRP